MKPLLLHSNADVGVTLLSNIFIDTYLPLASGNDVKIYILLLRHLSDASGVLSIEKIAHCLALTQEETIASLNALEKMHLLSLSRDARGEICSIRFETPLPAPDLSDSPTAIPCYVPAESEDSREEYNNLSFVCEQYLGRPLNNVDTQILYDLFYTDRIPSDLIEYAVEYCVEHNHSHMRYIDTVIRSWVSEGLRTPSEARKRFHAQKQFYALVFNTFGIGGRAPIDCEKEIMDRWMSYGFSEALIKEAVRLTVLNTHQAKFSYTEKILENWKENGVKCLDDVSVLNAAHAQKQQEQENLENAITYGKAKRPQNSFSSFGQRSTSDDDLQKKLLGLH